MIKRLLKIAELTVREQRLVIFAVCVLVAFVALKSCRHTTKGPSADATVSDPGGG